MTREEYNILAKYTHQYQTALESSYARGVTTDMIKEIKPIYDKYTKYTEKILLTCPRCMLDFVKKVGIFFNNIVEEEIELTPIQKARMAKKNKKATNNETNG